MTTTPLPGTSPLLVGMHEPPPFDVMPEGWILFLTEAGHSPEPHPGIDFTPWQGYGIICRIQHAWGDGGTLPQPQNLDGYVERVRTLVQNSQGCHRWIIGNEPNLETEWANGMKLMPGYVGLCYNRCWSAIHDLPGHEQDEVLVPPVGPWNIDTGIDWIEYFKRLIDACEFIDGFALHTYSRGPDQSSITSEDKMDKPYQMYYNGFRTYRDWLAAIPPEHAQLPTYLTETNQNAAWLNVANGWIPAMYEEINGWNKGGGQVIRCACLYRWPNFDPYYIEGKRHVIADLHTAMEMNYTWTDEPEPPPEESMVLNPGLEPPFNAQSDGSGKVARYWEKGHNEDPNDPSSKRPEWKAETTTDGQGRVLEGATAQKIFWTHGYGQAWIYQVVNGLTPGKWYEFKAHVWVWSSSTNHDGSESTPPDGKVWVRLGVHPWGVKDPNEWGTEFGGAVVANYDRWLELTTYFQAKTDRAALFLWGAPEHPAHHNDLYWDKVSLTEWACEGEPPVEPPVEPPEPGEPCEVDYARIRTIVREELDSTALGPR